MIFGAVHLGGGVWGIGTPKLSEKFVSLNIYHYQKKLVPLLKSLKKIDFGGSNKEESGGVVPPGYDKIFVSSISPDIKKPIGLTLAVQQTNVLGFIGGFFPNYVHILVC